MLSIGNRKSIRSVILVSSFMIHIEAFTALGIIPEGIRGEIELKDVHFSYPTRPDEPVHRGLSLQVPAGKTVALVGPRSCLSFIGVVLIANSGGGKSTVLSLIMRLYDVSNGAVMLDGHDARTYVIIVYFFESCG
jgi:ATP-binding cassette subfamily B (MDR/TAP) protein 1